MYPQPFWNGQQWVYPPTPQPTIMPVKTNHAMHLALTILTCGLYLPVWILVAMSNSGRTRKIY